MFGAMDFLKTSLDSVFKDIDHDYPYGSKWLVSEKIPRTNLYDKGDLFEVNAEVPGFDQEELSVKVQGNYLEISGKRKTENLKEYTTHRAERGITTFSRSFTMPADIDSNKTEASLKNGILTLILPKAEIAKPKQIRIN
jgi:HSP20 family protein